MNIWQRIQRRVRTIFVEAQNFWLNFIVARIPVHSLRRLAYRVAGMKIGKGSSIHMGLIVYDASGIEIGEDTIIGENCVLDGRGKLQVGSHTALASEVMIYNSEHDMESTSFVAITDEVKIGDFVFLGPRSIVMPGVDIGRGAVVAAGAVVTKNVEPSQIVAGVPAKFIKNRQLSKYSYKLGRAAWWR